MKGLESYIKKHGKHFTEELAYDISGRFWTFEEIDKVLQRKVYYNVSGCTPGDIVYCVNGMQFANRNEIVNFLLCCVFYDVGTSDRLFDIWVSLYQDFDITPYI